jgi:hypothetical protein
LLGAEFVPSSSGPLIIQVAESLNHEKQIEWSLASANDVVRVGIPRQHINSVLDGAQSEGEIFALSSGILRFDFAAHGEIGSSPKIFRQLAKGIVRLFVNSSATVSAEELENQILPASSNTR